MFSPCPNLPALKSRNSAFWSLALWATAAVLVVVPLNVEGSTLCYICKYIDYNKGRSNDGNSSFEGIVAKFPESGVEGRQSPPDDSSCASSTPSNTGLCPNGCLYSVYSNGGGTLYYRACAKPKPDGCETIEQGAKVCFCSTDLCNGGSGGGGNGGGAVNGSNQGSPCNGLYTAAVAIGAFVSLIFMQKS